MIALPRLMLVTQYARMKPDYLTALEAALHGGARLIQLREKELAETELLLLAAQVKALCRKYGALLLVNKHMEIVLDIDTDGVHLPEGGAPGKVVNASGKQMLYGVSCHSLEAARRAAGQGADYIVFGSVFETRSHPGIAPGGLNLLGEICSAIEIPVFAIGGMTAQNAQMCREAGAYGVAVIGAAWDAEDVEAAVRDLVWAAS